MPIGICPRCQQRYSYNHYDNDYVHECNSTNPTLDQEDVVVVGNYEDEATGSTIIKPRLEVNLQGIGNKLIGTRAGIEGRDLGRFTDRGARAETRRQRQHFEYIKLK